MLLEKPSIITNKIKSLRVSVEYVFRANFNDTYWLDEAIIDIDKIDRDKLGWFDPFYGKSKINDTCAGRMMLEGSLDVSKHLKKGENKISLTITAGNRNLLGPFHSPEGELGFVGPEAFERFGTWENGKSKHYKEKYSFVKNII